MPAASSCRIVLRTVCDLDNAMTSFPTVAGSPARSSGPAFRFARLDVARRARCFAVKAGSRPQRLAVRRGPSADLRRSGQPTGSHEARDDPYRDRPAASRPAPATIAHGRRPAARGVARRAAALEALGPVPERARLGHRARGLQRLRHRLGLLPARPRALARLPLERGRPRRHLRPPPAHLLRRSRCGTAAIRSSRSGSSA